ncbi:VOC family protein [Hirschia baltica]|uniref:Glyoxalase/bleomycin resistance protein/dioxygenase n=1 Tax=Hirschia baltica (strain ATCC 49814 / DSM 5838 / IFAM 1418) TaxID=582402 RepID=C6XPJ8_HIRBI|nr:VOC family protein [Hirschia baltica]ACT60263.1 Glyoxalase/bleomycin resistance protein/dioxygenase [Hirschia baltica ATCC 49814]
MSIIKVEDIAYVRFSAPDLSEMGSYLQDFGMKLVPHESGNLYARGVGAQPFLHATSEGPASFEGVGFRVSDVSELEILSKAEGVAVTALDAPGGGFVVSLVDPDGHVIEVVAGQELSAVAAVSEPVLRNDAIVKRRLRTPVRLEGSPANVVRLGHIVLEVKDFRVSEAWYKERFGFVTSDEIEFQPGFAIGAFLRCDRGENPTDHHTIFLLQSPAAPRFNHAAFEVVDIDDLMLGHAYLKKAKRESAWGVGRHVLGSQVFDYWKDPWGHELEHWTDGDLFTVADGSNKATLEDLLNVQWGPKHPMVGE